MDVRGYWAHENMLTKFPDQICESHVELKLMFCV